MAAISVAVSRRPRFLANLSRASIPHEGFSIRQQSFIRENVPNSFLTWYRLGTRSFVLRAAHHASLVLRP